MIRDEQTQLDKRGKEKTTNVMASRGKKHDMSLYELSRWCSMIDAVGIIDKKLDDMRVKNTNWVKPIAIQKYIDEKYQDVLHEMLTKDNL